MFNPKDVLHTQSNTDIGRKNLNNVVYRVDENTIVSITESINLSKIYRFIDSQSGSHISYIPTYIVRVYIKTTKAAQEFFTSTYKMTMEEVFDKYPWFFEVLRSI